MLEQLRQHPISSMYALMAMPIAERKALNIEELINDVCHALHLNRQILNSKTRETKYKFGRWLVWKIMRTHKKTLLECGKCFERDHTTVINALQNIDMDITHIPYLQEAYYSVKKHEYLN